MSYKFSVTVIISVCGEFHTFSECLRSLLKQSLKRFEIIVIDSERRAETKKAMRKMRNRNRRIVYAALPHTSENEKRNFGLSAAKGKYITWISADIRYTPDALSSMFEAAQENSADVVLAGTGGIGANNEYKDMKWTINEVSLPAQNPHICDSCKCSPLLYCFGWTSDKLFRCAFLTDKQCLFPAVRGFSDIPFTYEALSVGNVFVLKKTCVYTIHKDKIAFAFNPSNHVIDCFITVKALKEALERSNVFKLCERAYMTWCIQFVVWFYRTTKEETKEQFCKVLRERIEPFLQITEHGIEYYFIRKRFFKYAELCSEDDSAKMRRRLHEIEKITQKTLSVWGCCISREFLNVEKEAFYVNGYVFQCPPTIQFNCKPVYEEKIPYSVFDQTDMEGVWKLSSYLNFNKLALTYLKEHPADYLLIDFADLRLHSFYDIERKDHEHTKILATNHSGTCLKKCIAENYVDENSISKIKETDISNWLPLIEIMMQELSKLYGTGRIVLNQSKFARKYKRENKFFDFTEPYYDWCENIFSQVETYFLNNMKGCRFIPAPKGAYSVSDHRLGLFELHFCPTVEQYRMQALKKIIYEHASNEQIAELCKQCEEQLQKEIEGA